jgi:4-hydroxy-3-methylbut-2-enyl diphosphate reductase
MCADRVPTYHIAEPGCLVSAAEIRHRPIGAPSTTELTELVTGDWFPAGNVTVGLTAGASTPNNLVGEVIERLAGFAADPGNRP